MLTLSKFVPALMLSMLSASALASLEIEGPATFQSQVRAYLKVGKSISPHTHRLISAIASASMPVTIHPVTADPETWHPRGNATRSHTRSTSSDGVIIYINPKRIDPSHKSYSSGTLIHELVHALDLTSKRYHRDYVVREKRAVFFQNIWRQAHQREFREHYHWRFTTDEYQQAQKTGNIDDFIDYFFTYDDLPLTP